jgi:tryptophan synthase alpha chain
MSYWSPIEKYGVAKFAQAVSNAKGSGVITPDLTVEESDSWRVESDKNGLNRIYVVAPSTTSERLAKVTSECSGFIYAASLMGVTGTRDAVSANASSLVNRIRSTSNTPVAVGLGVSTKEQAKVVASYADGVIVGSAFIKIIQENGAGRSGLKKIKKLAQSLSEGVRDGR